MRIRLNLTRDPVEEKPHSLSCGKLWKKNLTPVEEKLTRDPVEAAGSWIKKFRNPVQAHLCYTAGLQVVSLNFPVYILWLELFKIVLQINFW